MRKFKKLANQLVNLGITENLSIESSQRIRLINILGLTPIFIYFYFIYFGLTQNYYFPAFISSFLTIGACIGLFYNHKQKYNVAKSILFSVNSFSVFIVYNVLNIDYSIVCYFFPLIMAYEIAFDAKKDLRYLLPTFTFTICCLIACFLLPKYLIYGYIMDNNLLNVSIMLNYLFPILLSIIFMFTIIKVHSDTQTKLITAREESERANKAKSDFLSNMSHELRTPLNGIIGANNLLMNEPASPSQKKYYEILQHTSDHMLHLINQILDFSKIKESKINLDRNTFNLKHVVSKLCRVQQAQNTQEEVVFSFDIDEDLNKNIVSDDLRLKQILLNLLSNAFKFTNRGSIHLSAKIISQNDTMMTVSFVVTDTGIGIKQEQLNYIFESFHQADNTTTRNFGGTGLGLSISKQLVSLFGSTLAVESVVGKGSRFSFNIIVEKDLSKPVDDVQINLNKDLRGLKILVAEDNKVNMLVLLAFLKKWNANYTEAENGAIALDKYQKNDFDIILMDLEMPIIDGYTAIKEIREKDFEIPVIAFTAALYDGMGADLKSKGFTDYLHKPFNPKKLFDKISEYLPS